MLKQFILKSLLLILILSPYRMSAQKIADSTILYGYEYIDYEGDLKSLPKIKVGPTEIRQALSKHAIYPKFAKHKFLLHTTDVITTIDEKGVISQISISEPYHAMFDTVAVKVVLATKGMWEPAIVKGKPKGRVITIPVSFAMYGDSALNSIEYAINIFASALKLSSDSTNTYPASVMSADSTLPFRFKKVKSYHKTRTFDKFIHKNLFDDNSLDPVFGSVRLGFNLSKDRNISDINILHSVSKKYDEQAIALLKDMKTDFIPAHEHGIPIDSYIEFDFRFDRYMYYRFNRHQILGHAGEATLKADELLLEKQSEKALPYLVKANNYFLDNIKILFQLALIHFQLNRIEEGCEYLSKIKSVAIDMLYPSTVKEEDVVALSETYCGH